MRRRACIAVAAALLAAASLSSPASAEGGAIYVDEVASYGGDRKVLRAELETALAHQGYAASFAAPGEAACSADDATCLAGRAERHGASLALRVTHLELAGEVAIAMRLFSVQDGRAARRLIELGDIRDAASELATALAALGEDLAPSGQAYQTRAWALTGTSAALAVAGGTAITWAYGQRRRFFADHVGDDGDIIGMSPAGAQSAERRAQAWALAGGLLVAGAAASGISAAFMFTGDSGGQGGALTLQGRF